MFQQKWLRISEIWNQDKKDIENILFLFVLIMKLMNARMDKEFVPVEPLILLQDQPIYGDLEEILQQLNR